MYLYHFIIHVQHKYTHCTDVTSIPNAARTTINMSLPDNTGSSFVKDGPKRLHSRHDTLPRLIWHLSPSPFWLKIARHRPVVFIPIFSILRAVLRTSESVLFARKPTSRPSTRLSVTTDNNLRVCLNGSVHDVMFIRSGASCSMSAMVLTTLFRCRTMQVMLPPLTVSVCLSMMSGLHLLPTKENLLVQEVHFSWIWGQLVPTVPSPFAHVHLFMFSQFVPPHPGSH